MDKQRFELGLTQRKAVLGAEYVEKNLEAADEFNQPFQEAMTEWCWGFGWGDEAIDVKTRSHYLTIQFAIPDAPRDDEVVIVLGGATGGRPHHRIGDRYQDLKDLGRDLDNPAAV